MCYSREDEIGTERRSRFWQLGDGNREEGADIRGDIVAELCGVCVRGGSDYLCARYYGWLE